MNKIYTLEQIAAAKAAITNLEEHVANGAAPANGAGQIISEILRERKKELDNEINAIKRTLKRDTSNRATERMDRLTRLTERANERDVIAHRILTALYR